MVIVETWPAESVKVDGDAAIVTDGGPAGTRIEKGALATVLETGLLSKSLQSTAAALRIPIVLVGSRPKFKVVPAATVLGTEKVNSASF